jgi:hypothetical protein
MPATGKTFEMEAMYMVRINNEGQIAEHWGVVDTIGTMGQLGLLPPQGESHRTIHVSDHVVVSDHGSLACGTPRGPG